MRLFFYAYTEVFQQCRAFFVAREVEPGQSGSRDLYYILLALSGLSDAGEQEPGHEAAEVIARRGEGVGSCDGLASCAR